MEGRPRAAEAREMVRKDARGACSGFGTGPGGPLQSCSSRDCAWFVHPDATDRMHQPTVSSTVAADPVCPRVHRRRPVGDGMSAAGAP